MQALLDFLPVIAFAVTYWVTKDFNTAILVIMAAVGIQVIVTFALTRNVPKMLLISAGLVIGLGGISLLLKNDLVFKWKPTVLNWAFALVFLGSQFIGAKPIIQRIMESVAKNEIQLIPAHWRTLNLMWALFFTISGAANIYVAYNFEEAVWVNFKLFGLLGFTLVFMVLQAFWISARVPKDQTLINDTQANEDSDSDESKQ
ncbi:MAG: intracellular septation protein [Gammaproteobacteria bacterium]|jgi:intracellular septation protein|tara:strand:+ start:1230 stop:1835 length:606 start_codon:yes stop_codon:yes gene_type:complete